jgi:hypothetical protein
MMLRMSKPILGLVACLVVLLDVAALNAARPPASRATAQPASQRPRVSEWPIVYATLSDPGPADLKRNWMRSARWSKN